MSNFSIVDGTGKGIKAKVTDDNKLLTSATTQTIISSVSQANGNAFSFPAVEKTIVASTEHHLLWIKNTNPNFNLNISRVVISHNGGNTSHNRVITGRARIGSSTPTVNNTSFNGASLNLGYTANVPLAESYVWNGTGTGMTIPSAGPIAFSAYFAQGYTDIIYDGAFVLSYNSVIDFSVTAEEDSLVSLNITGWYD